MTATIGTDIDPALTPDPTAVIVISGPGCQQCRATYRHLDARGIEYVGRDATEELSTELTETLRQKGKAALPIVVFPDAELINGFQPGTIDSKLADLPRAEVTA